MAQKWDHSEKRKSVGRPRIRQVIVDLILRFAKENLSWGYDRVQGAVANVGYQISDTTCAMFSSSTALNRHRIGSGGPDGPRS